MPSLAARRATDRISRARVLMPDTQELHPDLGRTESLEEW